MGQRKQSYLDTERHYNTKVIGATGASGTVIKPSGGKFGGIDILGVGAVSSTVEVYDGTVATGTKIFKRVGTAVGFHPRKDECLTSIRVVTVDSGGTMEIAVKWL